MPRASSPSTLALDAAGATLTTFAVPSASTPGSFYLPGASVLAVPLPGPPAPPCRSISNGAPSSASRTPWSLCDEPCLLYIRVYAPSTRICFMCLFPSFFPKPKARIGGHEMRDFASVVPSPKGSSIGHHSVNTCWMNRVHTGKHDAPGKGRADEEVKSSGRTCWALV